MWRKLSSFDRRFRRLPFSRLLLGGLALTFGPELVDELRPRQPRPWRQFAPGSLEENLVQTLQTGDLVLFNRDASLWATGYFRPYRSLMVWLSKQASFHDFDHVGVCVRDPADGTPHVLEWTASGISYLPVEHRVAHSTSTEIMFRQFSGRRHSPVMDARARKLLAQLGIHGDRDEYAPGWSLGGVLHRLAYRLLHGATLARACLHGARQRLCKQCRVWHVAGLHADLLSVAQLEGRAVSLYPSTQREYADSYQRQYVASRYREVTDRLFAVGEMLKAERDATHNQQWTEVVEEVKGGWRVALDQRVFADLCMAGALPSFPDAELVARTLQQLGLIPVVDAQGCSQSFYSGLASEEIPTEQQMRSHSPECYAFFYRSVDVRNAALSEMQRWAEWVLGAEGKTLQTFDDKREVLRAIRTELGLRDSFPFYRGEVPDWLLRSQPHSHEYMPKVFVALEESEYARSNPGVIRDFQDRQYVSIWHVLTGRHEDRTQGVAGASRVRGMGANSREARDLQVPGWNSVACSEFDFDLVEADDGTDAEVDGTVRMLPELSLLASTWIKVAGVPVRYDMRQQEDAMYERMEEEQEAEEAQQQQTEVGGSESTQ